MHDYTDDYIRRHHCYVLTDAELKSQLIEVAVTVGCLAFVVGATFGWWIA